MIKLKKKKKEVYQPGEIVDQNQILQEVPELASGHPSPGLQEPLLPLAVPYPPGRDVGQLGMMVTLSAQMAADLLETQENMKVTPKKASLAGVRTSNLHVQH